MQHVSVEGFTQQNIRLLTYSQLSGPDISDLFRVSTPVDIKATNKNKSPPRTLAESYLATPRSQPNEMGQKTHMVIIKTDSELYHLTTNDMPHESTLQNIAWDTTTNI